MTFTETKPTLQGGECRIGGAVLLRPSPALVLDLVVAVNAAVLLMILFAPGRLDLASGPQAARPGRHAASPAARADAGRAPCGDHSAPQSAAVGRASPPTPPAAVLSLFPAISWTESRDRDDAVGDGGRSRGRYQLSLPYWMDGGGDPARYRTDVLDPALCRRIMLGYWRRYCPAALAAADLETLARCHNGGPRGPTKRATEQYWLKVKENMR